MKKFIKVLSLVLVVVLSVTFLTGCSKCNQKYADKINEKAEQKKWVTYEKVMKDLGDEAKDATIEAFGHRGGFITLTEEKGNVQKVLTIFIEDGVAKSASYEEREIEEK